MILTQVLQNIEKAVVISGASILKQLAAPGEVRSWRKADQTLVMSIDLESQELIKSALGPDLRKVMEEDESTHRLIGSSDSYYLVDPVDGTANCKRFTGKLGGHIGFGPLVGFVHKKKLSACAYFNVPQRTLYSAVSGGGAWAMELSSERLEASEPLPSLSTRRRLLASAPESIAQSAALFFASKQGEARVAERLRYGYSIENTYRFGGFANDCTRIAEGFEELQIQFAVKAWDYSAVLLEIESGTEVVFDPVKSKQPFSQWEVAAENPMVAAPKLLMPEFLRIVEETYRS